MESNREAESFAERTRPKNGTGAEGSDTTGADSSPEAGNIK